MYHFSKQIILLAMSLLLLSITACDSQEITSEWTKEFKTESSDFIKAVKVDFNGDIIMVGTAFVDEDITTEKLLIVKYNSRGSLLWNLKYTFKYETKSLYINDTEIDNGGNIYISGDIGVPVVIKIKNDGTVVWEKAFVGTENWLTGGLVIKNDIVYMTNINTYMLNANTGDVLLTIPGSLKTTDIVLDTRGNICIAGYKFIASYDTKGNELWFHNWSSSNYSSVQLLGDNKGNIFAVTNSNSIYTMKIDSTTGTILTTAVEESYNFWNPMIALSGNNIIMAVSIDDGTWKRRVVKYTNNLSKTWSKHFDRGIKNMDLNQLLVDSKEDIYITGGNLTTKIDSNGNEIGYGKDVSSYTDNFIAIDPNENYLYLGTMKETYDNNNFMLYQFKL